ncbi:transmembrane protein, putative (macronuclear) [Tetrahymena thermophila SB210]|uniref:Transmembrane protein, putative n=1 Tax=Tetrahymena thermophila (strain SB210) TaxID=312017 RepID=W7XBK1_TETTS|nr:transmembrane protein, putative [Tetrahymena thermophila SB210]EWS74717.1 transmembrane protein, putative [Tetrahymena thermophila SB210]|eukprot:XP_012652718.1 transmembrane protein, putative [Tetrahymena thermophila SB210]
MNKLVTNKKERFELIEKSLIKLDSSIYYLLILVNSRAKEILKSNYKRFYLKYNQSKFQCKKQLKQILTIAYQEPIDYCQKTIKKLSQKIDNTFKGILFNFIITLKVFIIFQKLILSVVWDCTKNSSFEKTQNFFLSFKKKRQEQKIFFLKILVKKLKQIVQNLDKIKSNQLLTLYLITKMEKQIFILSLQKRIKFRYLQIQMNQEIKVLVNQFI